MTAAAPMDRPVDEGAPAGGALARAVFGDRAALAQRYADLLAGPGVARGLIGPRERDRLWDRHLVNSALVSELLPAGARVVDVGSGAGLPGLALMCRRADLRVDLVESMRRRVEFLQECVTALGLTDVARVVLGRAEVASVRAEVGDAEWVTARAVAPLARLAAWCLPLLRRDGWLLALKGAQAAGEVREARDAVHRAGGIVEEIARCGVELAAEFEGMIEPTTVVVVRKS